MFIGTVTIICVALLNVWHLYFTALSDLTVIEPITIVCTQFITPKTILHVRLIAEVPRIKSALYFAVIPDIVSKKILGGSSADNNYCCPNEPCASLINLTGEHFRISPWIVSVLLFSHVFLKSIMRIELVLWLFIYFEIFLLGYAL